MSEVRSRFEDRHIGPDAQDVSYLLKEIGESNLDAFIAKVVPANIAISQKLSEVLPDAISEVEAIEELRERADKNSSIKSLIVRDITERLRRR